MKYLDLFAGYGGFSLGIQKAYDEWINQKYEEPVIALEPECIGFSEIDKYAIQTYKKHFPKHKNYGDITKIIPKELPEFDILVGGFPCQAFSVAGERKGFEDTRGTLIFDVFRILKEKQPRLVLLENVKGLLSHDNGRTFKTIITSLAELGYAVEWQVLNAKNFGVPQNRERVFIVGHLGGFGGRAIFPIEGTVRATTWQNTIRRGGSKSLTKKHAWDIVQVNKPKHSNDRVYDPKGLCPTLNTMQGGRRWPKILQKARGKNNGGMHNIAPTVSCRSYQDNNHIVEDDILRRITPTECERLMGLPDGWTSGISESQRYKLCGNGVVVNVVQEIIKRLI